MATAARTSQFIRCTRVVVSPANGGEIEVANLTGRAAVRIRFDVRRSFDATDNTPQTATIWLYNLATTTRRTLEGQPGILAPMSQAWSKAQLLASDADRNYNGADAVVSNPEPVPGIELPA